MFDILYLSVAISIFCFTLALMPIVSAPFFFTLYKLDGGKMKGKKWLVWWMKNF